MAASINKDTLKKHHFWILVGLTPLFVLIAVITIDGTVGAEIEKKNKDIMAAQDAMRGKESPKSEVFLSRFNTQLEELNKKKTDLWRENWERQIGLTLVKGKQAQDPNANLLRWPKSQLLDRFNYTTEYASNKNQLKFGDRIPDDNGESNEFRKQEVYIAEFSNPYLKDPAREPEKRTGMADRIWPTTFNGGWSSVLRHVQTPGGWGERKATSEQLWLALEDIWVQRALVGAIKNVNDSIGAFNRAPRYDANGAKLEDTNLERAFRSPIWYVGLKVSQRPGDGRYVITGTLSNHTDRLQMMGAGNMLVLNVWLSSAPNAQPFQFRIGGEFVAGKTTIQIPPAEEHVLPAGTAVEEIAKVEQVFDAKTVPIRRVDHIALGKKDSRYVGFQLKRPDFEAFKKEEEAAAASGAASGGNEPGGAPPMGSGGGPPPGSGSKFPGAIGASGGSGSGSAAEGQLEGGGSVASVLDGNRKRYVDVTKQIRRMPVGITVIVDQAYIEDVLLAYANLPMRFQITQYHWQRFRGQLGSSGSSGGPGIGFGEEIGGPARGYEGSGGVKFGSAGGPPPGMGGPPPGGPGPGSGSPRPPGVGGPPGPPSAVGSGGPGIPGVGAPGMTGGFNPGSATFSDAQISAGLVELTIYGIVSLYEKYEPEAAPQQ
jgi:hypothetical protein